MPAVIDIVCYYYLCYDTFCYIPVEREGTIIVSLEYQVSILHTFPEYAHLRQIFSSMLTQAREADKSLNVSNYSSTDPCRRYRVDQSRMATSYGCAP